MISEKSIESARKLAATGLSIEQVDLVCSMLRTVVDSDNGYENLLSEDGCIAEGIPFWPYENGSDHMLQDVRCRVFGLVEAMLAEAAAVRAAGRRAA